MAAAVKRALSNDIVEVSPKKFKRSHESPLAVPQSKGDPEISLAIEDTKIVPTVYGKPVEEFRNYEQNPRQKRVQDFYQENHAKQTYEFVQSMHVKYVKNFNSSGFQMGLWEALEWASTFVDDSDPDIDLSQLVHALQTAEASRKLYPGEEYDWLHLTALIHDLGKFLAFKFNEPQWCVTGDTFPVGCRFSEKCVFPEFFADNKDFTDPAYNTELGVYKPACGLENIFLSFGHDEYMYWVCKLNQCKLPKQALFMIRYHSFYPLHKEGAYTQFLHDEDQENLRWVREFNQFDLYSKAAALPDVEVLAPYYKGLIAKYFPATVKW